MMTKMCDPLLCNGCSACAAICKQDCIQMVPDIEGFLRPVVDQEKCVQCGLCEKVCPIMNPVPTAEEEPEYWGAINQYAQDRSCASSGGVFILLSKWILDKGGVVFGAAFDEDFSVAHDFSESEQGVYRFCGSKYVQSSMGTAYRDAHSFLKQGRYVLFSGTPCQISGLRNFLGKEYDNLVLVDIICHGVPSPMVWKSYLQERMAVDQAGTPRRINFRAKTDGWSRFGLQIVYDENEYLSSHREDAFMIGFLSDLYLRPSCYRCVEKGTRRKSDFTLADFWGVQTVCPTLFDDKGTSLVLLQSKKAKMIWGQIRKDLCCMLLDRNALAENPAATTSMAIHPNREAFFSRFLYSRDVTKLIVQMSDRPVPPVVHPPLYRRVLGKIRRMIWGFFRKLFRK